MRRVIRLGLAASFVLALAIPAGAQSASNGAPARNEPAAAPHNFETSLSKEQSEARALALEMQLQGKIASGAKVAKVNQHQFVELVREGEDSIWTVLGEFGPDAATHTHFGQPLTHTGPPGPLHNEIPQPDRTVDNSTIWTSNFSQDYYKKLLFSEGKGVISMRQFYIEQSSNRYTVNGDVTDWAKVPFNAASYGSNYCGDIVCGPDTWRFVRDSVNGWYNAQLAAGKTAAEIDAYLAQYDKWDRYDHDGDGNFNEADGYIDHFQSLHAGEGEETGGGAQGSDAIWSHRWYVQLVPIGGGGPVVGGSVVPFGGTPIGNSKYWIGDYTIEPENGGVGVFSHEFGHDLGLPDLYDTSGNTCGSACENSTGFWTLMSSGSYGNDGTIDIGSKPVHMGVWEKFQLGWLGYPGAPQGQFYKVAIHGQAPGQYKLGPAETASTDAQALFVVLPDKKVIEQIATPYAGGQFYYSGSGNNLDNRMTKSVALPAGATLKAKVQYATELDWDYAYLTVNGTSVHTNLSTSTNPNGQNFGEGITGSTGGNWVDLTADLSAYAGQTVTIGFRYWTDGAVVEPGFMIDNIEISGQALDGAEAPAGWTLTGFRTTTGTEEAFYFNAYVVENRQYLGFDQSLKTGPYNFGFLNDPALGNKVEHFPYQDGVLISYWDESQSDNSTSAHPGAGLILPIDAHPAALLRADGQPWRSRIQSYDSTFGREPTDAIKLHNLGQESSHPSLPAVTDFDDRKQYWNPATPAAGVKNPQTGTQLRVTHMGNNGFATVAVRFFKVS